MQLFISRRKRHLEAGSSMWLCQVIYLLFLIVFFFDGKLLMHFCNFICKLNIFPSVIAQIICGRIGFNFTSDYLRNKREADARLFMFGYFSSDNIEANRLFHSEQFSSTYLQQQKKLHLRPTFMEEENVWSFVQVHWTLTLKQFSRHCLGAFER